MFTWKLAFKTMCVICVEPNGCHFVIVIDNSVNNLIH